MVPRPKTEPPQRRVVPGISGPTTLVSEPTTPTTERLSSDAADTPIISTKNVAEADSKTQTGDEQEAKHAAKHPVDDEATSSETSAADVKTPEMKKSKASKSSSKQQSESKRRSKKQS